MGTSSSNKNRIEVVEPIGTRVLIRKDEDKKVTKVGQSQRHASKQLNTRIDDIIADADQLRRSVDKLNSLQELKEK